MTKEIEGAMESEILRIFPGRVHETRARAIDKLHGIVNKIGYPDKWRDYSSVKIVRGDFLEMKTEQQSSSRIGRLEKIGKPVDRGEWQMTPPTVNAYYDAQLNDLNFPAGVLQPPLFDPKMDDAPNCGNHGIHHRARTDPQVRRRRPQVRRQGELHDWWTKQDAAAFVVARAAW